MHLLRSVWRIVNAQNMFDYNETYGKGLIKVAIPLKSSGKFNLNAF